MAVCYVRVNAANTIGRVNPGDTDLAGAPRRALILCCYSQLPMSSHRSRLRVLLMTPDQEPEENADNRLRWSDLSLPGPVKGPNQSRAACAMDRESGIDCWRWFLPDYRISSPAQTLSHRPCRGPNNDIQLSRNAHVAVD